MSLNRTLRELEKLGRAVIYRSTWASFMKCETLPDPLPSIREADLLLEQQERDDPKTRSWHWSLFQRQNAIARQLVGETKAVFWDVYEPTKLRPGGRRGRLTQVHDCMHWCLPGPLDELAKALLQYLVVIAHGTRHASTTTSNSKCSQT